MDDWGAGFVLNNYTVTNTGSSAVSGWTVQLTFPHQVNVSNAWNAQLSASSGSQLTVGSASYNGALQPGQSASFGMQGSPGGVGIPGCSVQ